MRSTGPLRELHSVVEVRETAPSAALYPVQFEIQSFGRVLSLASPACSQAARAGDPAAPPARNYVFQTGRGIELLDVARATPRRPALRADAVSRYLARSGVLVKALLLFSFGLLLGCAPRAPLGKATRNAFAAQVSAGARPDGASHLTTEEARAILGEERGSAKRPAPKNKRSSQAREKEPLNPDFLSGQ